MNPILLIDRLIIDSFIYSWIYCGVYIINLYIFREKLFTQVGHLQTLSISITQAHPNTSLSLLEQNASWEENSA